MPLKTVVRCYFKTFGDFVITYSSDVSQGGLFIPSNESIGEGELVRLEFKLRNDYPLITGEGEVVGVSNGGFTANFTKLDADSEKFLNEVVRVKAAELKLDPAAPKPVFDVKVEQEDLSSGGDEFDDAFEQIEEVEEIEATEMTADPFEEEDIFAEPSSGAEADFSGVSLNSDEPAEIDDPFGVSPAADPFGDEPATAFDDTGGYEDVEAAEPPSVELDDDGFEPVEQSPANPQALFDDIPADDGIPYSSVAEPGEQTVGGGTTIFERISTLKERRALLIGVSVGVLVLALGGGAYLYLGAGFTEGTANVAPKPAAVAQVLPAGEATTAATAVTDSAVVAAAATTVTLPEPVAAAEKPMPSAEPVAAAKPVAPAAAPIAKPAVAKPVAQAKVQASKTSPAKFVTAIESFGDRIEIIGDGAFGQIKHFDMGAPNRIVVDIYGVDKKFKGNRDGKGKVARIRPGVHPTKVRFVLDLASEKGKIPAYSVDKESDRVVVRFQ